MALPLAGLRGVIEAKAAEIKAVGTKSGYELHAGGVALTTEAGRPRVFKNLSTLAKVAHNEGVQSMILDLSMLPKPPRKRKAPAGPLVEPVLEGGPAPITVNSTGGSKKTVSPAV